MGLTLNLPTTDPRALRGHIFLRTCTLVIFQRFSDNGLQTVCLTHSWEKPHRFSWANPQRGQRINSDHYFPTDFKSGHADRLVLVTVENELQCEESSSGTKARVGFFRTQPWAMTKASLAGLVGGGGGGRERGGRAPSAHQTWSTAKALRSRRGAAMEDPVPPHLLTPQELCSGFPQQWDNPQVFTDLPDLPDPHTSLSQWKISGTDAFSWLASYLRHCSTALRAWLLSFWPDHWATPGSSARDAADAGTCRADTPSGPWHCPDLSTALASQSLQVSGCQNLPTASGSCQGPRLHPVHNQPGRDDQYKPGWKAPPPPAHQVEHHPARAPCKPSWGLCFRSKCLAVRAPVLPNPPTFTPP